MGRGVPLGGHGGTIFEGCGERCVVMVGFAGGKKQ